MVENPPANAGDIRDVGSILATGRSPGAVHGRPLPWAEESGRPPSIGSQSLTQLGRFSMHACIYRENPRDLKIVSLEYSREY